MQVPKIMVPKLPNAARHMIRRYLWWLTWPDRSSLYTLRLLLYVKMLKTRKDGK
jgi:hypothetical protein